MQEVINDFCGKLSVQSHYYEVNLNANFGILNDCFCFKKPILLAYRGVMAQMARQKIQV